MGKKGNTAIFMLVATVLNLVLLSVFFIVGLLIVNYLVTLFPESETFGVLMIFLLFIGAIAGSFFVYTRIVNWAVVKWNLEDKLDPIFRPRSSRKRGE